MGPVGGVGHVSAACGASPVVSGLPLNPNPIGWDQHQGGKGVKQMVKNRHSRLIVNVVQLNNEPLLFRALNVKQLYSPAAGMHIGRA